MQNPHYVYTPILMMLNLHDIVPPKKIEKEHPSKTGISAPCWGLLSLYYPYDIPIITLW